MRHDLVWTFFCDTLPERFKQVQEYFELEEDQRRLSQTERSSIPAQQAQARKLFEMTSLLRDAIQKTVLGDFEHTIEFVENLMQLQEYIANQVANARENMDDEPA